MTKDQGTRLFVDDLRSAKPGWIIVRNYDTAISVLSSFKVDIVSLDHDLGSELTGYDIAKWIEERTATDPSYDPPYILCHSSNPVGRSNIEACAESIKRIREDKKDG